MTQPTKPSPDASSAMDELAKKPSASPDSVDDAALGTAAGSPGDPKDKGPLPSGSVSNLDRG